MRPQRYLELRPNLPAVLPTETQANLRHENMADVMRAQASLIPEHIGTHDPRRLVAAANMSPIFDPRTGLRNFGTVDGNIEREEPVAGKSSVYLVPVFMKPLMPVLQMALDDIHTRDANASDLMMDVIIRRVMPGSVSPFSLPHIDISGDVIDTVHRVRSQYVIATDRTPSLYPMNMTSADADQLATALRAEEDYLETTPLFKNIIDRDKIAGQVFGPGELVHVSPYVPHNAPEMVLEKARVMVRIDFAFAVNAAEMDLMETRQYPPTMDLSPQERLYLINHSARFFHPERYAHAIQARHRRKLGPLSPVTLALSRNFGKLRFIPSVIRKSHRVEPAL